MTTKQLLVSAAAAVVVGAVATPAQATLYLNENFSTYASGNLVGQNGWTQLGPMGTLPLQVAGSSVVVPSAQSADNQDAWKDNTAGSIPAPGVGTTSIFYGLDLTVQNAPFIGPGGFINPSYLTAVYTGAGASGFANLRLSAEDNSTNVPGTYVLAARITGQTGNPFTVGTTPLTYGTPYNVVVEADMVAGAGNDTLEVFVNGSPYLVNLIGGGSDPTGIGSLVISQFGSPVSGNVGATIGGVRMADNFAEAAGVPEPSTLMLTGLSLIGLLTWPRRGRNRR
jgi:hypothetical protein